MSRRGNLIARGLAALSLAAATLFVVLAVSSSLGSEDGGDGGGSGGGGGDRAAAGCKPEAKGAVKAGYYVIQENDLLGLIAERTCVPQEELVRLNPELDPQALAPGQCISLVKRGCKQRE